MVGHCGMKKKVMEAWRVENLEMLRVYEAMPLKHKARSRYENNAKDFGISGVSIAHGGNLGLSSLVGDLKRIQRRQVSMFHAPNVEDNS